MLSVLEVDKLLQPIAGDSPCGEDLSYDASYSALLKDAEGTPERQVGDSILAAEEPHWPTVKSAALDLFSRSKDLRLAMLLTLASMQTDGLEGLSDGLRLVGGLLDRWWDAVIPRLDPDDRNDPTERVNIVSALAVVPSTFGDTARYQERASRVPLCASAQLGRFSLEDMRFAAGDDRASPDRTVAQPSVIEGALADTPLDKLQATRATAEACLNATKAIDAAFQSRAGAGIGPNLASFRGLFADMIKRLDAHLATRTGSRLQELSDGAGGTQAGESGGNRGLTGQIRNADDVRRAIDIICQYYERHEPSSPIPILLRRAQRLVSKNFLDIIRDMSPEALDKLSTISGENLTEQR